MLPVSGAEQLKTSLAQPIRPISSAQRAYSRLVSCVPSNSKLSSTWRSAWLGGMNRFHSPAERASGFSSSITSIGCQRSPASSCDLRSEEHTSELQSRQYLVCRLLLEKKT